MRDLKQSTYANLLERENLFICKEDENYKTTPDVVADASVLFILSVKPWAIQAMKMWLQQLNPAS